jgi:hypothetical protein
MNKTLIFQYLNCFLYFDFDGWFVKDSDSAMSLRSRFNGKYQYSSDLQSVSALSTRSKVPRQ